MASVDPKKRVREIPFEIRKLNKLRMSYARKSKNKTFMMLSKRKLRKLKREQEELVKQLHDGGLVIDRPSMSIIPPDQLSENMKCLYQQIIMIKPTHDDVKAFAEEFWEWNNVVKEAKTNCDSVEIRLHRTFNRYRTRFHVDVFSGRHHLVLDRTWAPVFIEKTQK